MDNASLEAAFLPNGSTFLVGCYSAAMTRAGINRLVALALLSSLTFASAQPSGWTRYCNARFAFCLEIPPALVAQGEAPNGDGQVFKSNDSSVTLRAYGSFNALNQTPRQRLEFDSQGKRVTYRFERPGVFVVSGMDGQNIFYRRTVYPATRDKFVSFVLTYPPAQRSGWEPLLARLGRSLVLGK